MINKPEKKKTVRDSAFYRAIGAKGGKNTKFRPFRDIPGLAKRAGSARGYKQKKGSI
jgi:hypothetical protein